jgi:sigma-E factor negative regulatory protein RseA
MKERLSAVMDGEIEGPECAACLDRLKDDLELRETWRAYHLIGDAMRGHVGGALPSAFADRLAAEPTVLAPRRVERKVSRTPWYALSAAASVAAVALVGWTALSLYQAPVEIAARPSPAAPATVVVEAPAAPVPAAQGVNDYLLAHQRFSPSSALGGMAPYIRTVSEANGAR